MLYRILITTIAIVTFLMTYLAASVFAWVAQGLAGLDHASESGIAIGLMLGHILSFAAAVVMTLAVVKLGAKLRRRLARRRTARRS